MQRHEGFFEGHGGLTLFFQTWQHPQSRGTIIITHGQGEHSECYNRVIDALKDDGWSFWAWDLRGHGRSEGKRGYAAEFEDYVVDYRIFLRQALASPEVKSKPVVLLSHSMGGLIQLKTLIENPNIPATAQVCSSPLLGIAKEVPGWKSSGAKILNSIYPQMTLWNELRNSDVTRDPDVIREFEQDVLRHTRISSGVFLGFQPAFEYVLARGGQIKLPSLFQIPEADPVVSSQKTQEFFKTLGSTLKFLKVYGDGARHEIYNDLHREIVLKDLKDFLHPYLEARP